MKIIAPCDWKPVDLLNTEDANEFGEALRHYCFVGNSQDYGCYTTFNLIKELKEVKCGKIFEETKKAIVPEFEDSLQVHYFKLEEKDCWIAYGDPEENPCRMKICEPYEIICAWEWNGDGTLYFRFNNRKVINTDCKKDYEWEWINK